MNSEPRVRIEVEVMFYDTDCGGVVSNIAYLRFVEAARTALTSRLGMSPAEMTETQLFPAVVRTEIDYRRPARLGDGLTVSAEIDRLEKIRIHCRFEIVRESDETVIASARQTVALVQLPEGSLRRVPEEWVKKWPHLVD